MRVHNTCLHFAGRLRWMEYPPLLSQNLQVDIMSQLPVLGLFLDKPYRLNFTKMNLLKEFGATKVGLAKVGSKLVPLTLWASLI